MVKEKLTLAEIKKNKQYMEVDESDEQDITNKDILAYLEVIMDEIYKLQSSKKK